MPDFSWEDFTPIDGGAATATEPKEVDWSAFEPIDFISAQEAIAAKPSAPSSLTPAPPPGYAPPFAAPVPLPAAQQIGTAAPPPMTISGQDLAAPTAQAKARQYAQLQQDASTMTTPLVNMFPELTAQIQYEKEHPLPGAMGQFDQAVAGIGEGITDFANGMTSPENLALLISSMAVGGQGPALAKAVETAWATYMGKQLSVDMAQELGSEFGKPPEQRDTQKIAKLLTEAAAQAGITVGAGRGVLTRRPTYAGSQQKAAEVHGDVRTQPEPARVVPTEEGGPGVQPQAEAVAQEAQISLTQTGELRAEEEADLHEAIAMLKEDPAVTGQRQVGVNPDGTPKFEDTKQDPSKLRLLKNLEEIRDQAAKAEPKDLEQQISDLEADPAVTGKRLAGINPDGTRLYDDVPVDEAKVRQLENLKALREQGVTRQAPPEEMTEEEMRDQAQVNVLAGLRGKVQPTREELAVLYENEYQRLKYQPREGITLDDIEKQALGAVKEAGLTAEVVDSPTDPNAPFSGDKGTFGMRALGNGKVQISRSGLARLIKVMGIRPENIGEFIKRTVEHERMHDQVISTIGHEGAEDYWNDLTAAEKAIASQIYEGNWNPKYHTPSQMGHEVIRRRLEKAAGMDPWEFLGAVGKEKWSLKSLQLLDDIISKARDAWGTRASARQLVLLRHVQENIRTAINHMGGVAGPEAAARGEPTDPTEIAKALGNVRFNAVFDTGLPNLPKKWMFTLTTPGRETTFVTDVGVPMSVVARRAAIKDLMMERGITDEAEATRLLEGFRPPEAQRRRQNLNIPMADMDRALEESVIEAVERAGPKPSAEVLAMGYKPNIFTTLDELSQMPVSMWPLSGQNKADLLRWWDAQDGTGYGRAEFLESSIRSHAAYAKHQMDLADEIRQQEKFHEQFPAWESMTQGLGPEEWQTGQELTPEQIKASEKVRRKLGKQAQDLEDDAQLIIDSIGPLRKLLQEITGEQVPQFRDPDSVEEFFKGRPQSKFTAPPPPPRPPPRKPPEEPGQQFLFPEASVRRKPGESDEEFLRRIRTEAGKPGRRRPPAESQYQEKLFVPPVTKEQIEPRPSMEQVYGKPITEGWEPPKSAELEALAQQSLASASPDFEDFFDAAKKQFGPGITRDQLATTFEDQMWRQLVSATPMQLAAQVKGMGLEGKIGIRRRGEGAKKVAAPGEAELKAAGAVLGEGARVSGVTVEDIAARIAQGDPTAIQAQFTAEPATIPHTAKGESAIEAEIKRRKVQADLLRNEANRWEQAKNDLFLDDLAKDKLQRKIDALLAKASFVEAGGAEKAEKSKPKATEEEAFERRARNTRSLAMSAIAQKIMGTMEHDPVSLTRDQIGHEDIDFENENTVEGPVVEITKAQSEHRPTLGKILTEGARRSSRDPVSNTKRVGVFVNENTGVVDVLSTYDHGRSGAMIYRPGVPGVKGGYRKLSELPPNMRAVYALLLKDPVKDFHMRFDSLGDFNKHFRMPEALEKARAFEYRMYVGEEAPRMNARPMTAEAEEAAYEGTDIPEGGIVQGPAAGTVRGEMGMGRGALEKGKGRAIVGSEANALHDFLKEQQVEEPGDLQAAVDIIAETAKRKGLRGKHWVVVNALDKALAATERIHPEMTTQQVYEKTLEDIFALHQASQTPDAFVSGAMELYGKEPGPGPAALATSPEFAAAQAVRAQQRIRQATGQPAPVTQPGAQVRELTMRQRLPPTVTRGVVPSGVPQELPQGRPAISGPPARLSAAEAATAQARAAGLEIPGLPPYQPTEVRTSPELEARNITLQPGARGERPMLSAADRPMTARERAAKRELARYNERLRQLAYTSERYPAPEAFARAKAEAEAASEQAKEWFQAGWGRREVKAEEINMPMDVADNSAHVLARTSGNEIRLSSLKGLVQTAGKHWDNMMARMAQRREAVKTREAAVAVLATGEIQAMPHPTQRNKVKMVWMTNRQTLQDLIAMANNGIRHAQHALTSSDPRLAKIVGPSWMKGAKRLKEIAEYAQAHWTDPQLQDTVHQIRKQVQDQYKRERANGIRTARDFNYYPGRYEGELWNDHAVFFPALSVLGRNFRKPKTFRNSWEAIENGPYVPKNYDAADVIEHRVRQGMSLVNQKIWQNRLKGILDPDSNEPIATEPIKGPGGLQPPTPEYQLVPFQQGRSTLAIRKGFVNTVRAAAGEGGLRDIPVLAEALRLSQWLKHNGLLIYDTFHPARLAQYQAALTGYLPGYRGGFSALEFKEGSLPTAVAKGLISQKAADWATGTIDVNFGKAKVPMSRYQILQAHIEQGLNIGRLQDALYAQVGRVMPGLKPMNKLIFDRITRGFMAESVVRNFEKMNKSHPDTPFKTLVRDVAKDINYFYGNLGRQGSILSRNPTLRDLNQLFFLAPSWVEGLAQKELRFYGRAANLPLHAIGKGYRQGLPPLGALGGGMAKGLASYFALTQALNLMFRRQFTFQNEESGHKWDAFIPIGEHGFWVNPASVFAELTHDFLRLTETKPMTWDVIDQIGRNKLGPWGRFGMVIAREKNDMGQQITSTPGMVKAMAGEMVPYPITLTTPAQYVGSKLGLNRPPAPGALPRQLAASLFGVKTSPGESAATQTMRAARQFVKSEGLRGEPVRLVPTDEASYVKLSAAIRDGDEGGAEENLKKLRKTHSIEQIFKAMKMRATRPFTGSRMDENYFLGSLDKNGLDLYTKAQAERQDDLMKFYQFMGGLKQIP